MECFPAHIRINDVGEEQVQTSADHCHAVAKYTAASLEEMGLFHAGMLAGLLHDAGKFCQSFSSYISRRVRGESIPTGSVNHTFTGVRLLFERYHNNDASCQSLCCEILAAACGSHHGLFDCIDKNGQDGFTHRLEKDGISYTEAKDNFFAHCTTESALDELFDDAVKEIGQTLFVCKSSKKTGEELHFFLSLVCRLILSALIDADRRDTAQFMYSFVFKKFPSDMRPIWRARLAAVEQNLDSFSADSPINQARQTISQQCRSFSADKSGIYRLSVPTGGGKTLATLRFALATAEKHNKARIFFVIPLLSVLEQNAKVIRDFLDCDELVLEHHSNIIKTKTDNEQIDYKELLTETWHSPVVITTMVQLLNALFSDNGTCIRRMNALTNSVIVIDEVQSLPRHLISQFNLAMNFLAEVCNSTVVLCTATQPCLEGTQRPMHYSQPSDIVPYANALWQPFKRTTILDRCRPSGYTAEELAAFILAVLPTSHSVLLICNKKDQATALYNQLHHADARVFHLSTSMCMAHRIDTMDNIKAALGKTPVICVATQLVEAGVDFSFGCVVRVSAGMDNVIQAAGRCNRNGEFNQLCPVYIVNLRGENLSHLKEIRETQNAAMDLLNYFKRDSRRFGDDLQSNEAIKYYYTRLFKNMPLGAQDHPIEAPKTTLINLLSNNTEFKKGAAQIKSRLITQAFLTAGRKFKVFDDNSSDVLVPYGEGVRLISELCSARATNDFSYRKQLLYQARKYSVSLFDYQVNALDKNHGLRSMCDEAILAILPEFYDSNTGIDINCGAHTFMEV